MGKIVDIHGRPFDAGVLLEAQTASNEVYTRNLKREFANHPSAGLTVAGLVNALRLAELGNLRAQHELYMDMEEKDAHIFAEMQKRRMAIQTLDWSIKPPLNASKEEEALAAWAQERITDLPNFEDVLFDLLDAIGHGFSPLEIRWQKQGAELLPIELIKRPQSWFQLAKENQDELRLRSSSANGEELWPFGWVVHVHRAKSGYLARAGLHRVLVWPFLFKNYAVRDWAEFLEIYGLPLRIGTYHSSASDDEKATLLNAVVSIGHDAAAIMPSSMAMEFKEAAKGGSEPFEAMINWAEKSVSKAILGGTLTTQADGKSSTNALGNVHNEVRNDLKAADARQLAETLTTQLIYPMLVVNKGVTNLRRCPRLVFDTQQSEDLALMANALPKLVAVGMQIPAHYAHEKLKIPIAKDGEPLLAVHTPPIDSQSSKTDRAAWVAASANLAPLTELDEIDSLAAAMADGWEEVMTPIINPLLSAAKIAAQRGESLESFRDSLANTLTSMDSSALVDMLTNGQFVAGLYGRLVKTSVKR